MDKISNDNAKTSNDNSLKKITTTIKDSKTSNDNNKSFKDISNDNDQNFSKIMKNVNKMVASQKKETSVIQASISSLKNSREQNTTNVLLNRTLALQKSMLDSLKNIEKNLNNNNANANTNGGNNNQIGKKTNVGTSSIGALGALGGLTASTPSVTPPSILDGIGEAAKDAAGIGTIKYGAKYAMKAAKGLGKLGLKAGIRGIPVLGTIYGLIDPDPIADDTKDIENRGNIHRKSGTHDAAKAAADKYYGKEIESNEWGELIKAVHAEAGNNDKEQAMIMASVLNRSKRRNMTIHDILTETNAFAAVTGTPKNGNKPSQNFIDGPSEKRIGQLYGSIASNLENVPHEQEDFTAASSAAYNKNGGGNTGWRDKIMAKPEHSIQGGSVFNTTIKTPAPNDTPESNNELTGDSKDILMKHNLKKNPATVTGMQPSFAGPLSKFLQAAEESGNPINIKSGYRSVAEQTTLYNNKVSEIMGQGYNQATAMKMARKYVAPPGKSNHNKGLAADLGFTTAGAKAWAHANASKFGLNFRMGYEPWHIEGSGAGAEDAGSDATPVQKSDSNSNMEDDSSSSNNADQSSPNENLDDNKSSNSINPKSSDGATPNTKSSKGATPNTKVASNDATMMSPTSDTGEKIKPPEASSTSGGDSSSSSSSSNPPSMAPEKQSKGQNESHYNNANDLSVFGWIKKSGMFSKEMENIQF